MTRILDRMMGLGWIPQRGTLRNGPPWVAASAGVAAHDEGGPTLPHHRCGTKGDVIPMLPTGAARGGDMSGVHTTSTRTLSYCRRPVADRPPPLTWRPACSSHAAVCVCNSGATVGRTVHSGILSVVRLLHTASMSCRFLQAHPPRGPSRRPLDTGPPDRAGCGGPPDGVGVPADEAATVAPAAPPEHACVRSTALPDRQGSICAPAGGFTSRHRHPTVAVVLRPARSARPDRRRRFTTHRPCHRPPGHWRSPPPARSAGWAALRPPPPPRPSNPRPPPRHRRWGTTTAWGRLKPPSSTPSSTTSATMATIHRTPPPPPPAAAAAVAAGGRSAWPPLWPASLSPSCWRATPASRPRAGRATMAAKTSSCR